jgi:hypothetical protein
MHGQVEISNGYGRLMYNEENNTIILLYIINSNFIINNNEILYELNDRMICEFLKFRKIKISYIQIELLNTTIKSTFTVETQTDNILDSYDCIQNDIIQLSNLYHEQETFTIETQTDNNLDSYDFIQNDIIQLSDLYHEQ